MGRIDEAKQLRDLWSGFWAARVVLTANNLRVFDHLARPLTAPEAAELLGADTRGTEILLNALVSLGLLTKRGGRFVNSAVARRYLVAGAPWYMGDIIRHSDTLWRNWSGLDEVVRTGRPARLAHDHDAFIRGMHNLASFKDRDLMKAIGLKGVATALDLGGGPGTYSMAMARKGIRATLFDMPDTIRIARELVHESGVEGVSFREGDFLADDIGAGYDLILVSQVIHAYGPAENRVLLEKCRAALNPGGRVAIHEFLIDRSQSMPRSGALFAVNMLVNTDHGRCYPPEEIARLLRRAGFRSTATTTFGDGVLVSGNVP
ncbi:MAG: methyltransferase domain-containing protein [Desulfuromonadales bacterium]|nr:MAG: methyltransferase domain-containing protein [Desulfuromonadales bacterium]